MAASRIASFILSQGKFQVVYDKSKSIQLNKKLINFCKLYLYSITGLIVWVLLICLLLAWKVIWNGMLGKAPLSSSDLVIGHSMYLLGLPLIVVYLFGVYGAICYRIFATGPYGKNSSKDKAFQYLLQFERNSSNYYLLLILYLITPFFLFIISSTMTTISLLGTTLLWAGGLTVLTDKLGPIENNV